MVSGIEIHQIGGSLATIELIYRILSLRKEGYTVSVKSYDEIDEGVFYLAVSKDGSGFTIKVAMRSGNRIVRNTVNHSTPIDEHFVLTDLPMLVQKEMSYMDFVALMNIYSRVCGYIVLFSIIGKECLYHFSKYEGLLASLTRSVTSSNVTELVKQFFIGNDENNQEIYESMINGFKLCIEKTKDKFLHSEKHFPGKGRAKSLIYHVAFTTALSSFISLVNEPHKGFSMNSWNPSNLLKTLVDKDIDNQVKYVALESFTLLDTLTRVMTLYTGIDRNSRFGSFFMKLIELGSESAVVLNEADETFGVEIDGEISRYEFINKTINKIRNKLSYDADKSKFCFRCSKHYANYLFGYNGSQYVDESQIRQFDLLEFYGKYYAEIIGKKDSEAKDFIISEIVSKIVIMAYTSNPYVHDRKLFERLISYNVILRTLDKSNNGRSNDLVSLGIAYSDTLICYLVNMWVFNTQTQCIKEQKDLIRLALMMNYLTLFNLDRVNDFTEKETYRDVAKANIELLLESSNNNKHFISINFKINPKEFHSPEPETALYMCVNGLYGALFNSDYKSMQIYNFIASSVDSINNKESIMERLMKDSVPDKFDEDEEFKIVAIDKTSKLNYIIYKQIDKIYSSTSFSINEKAFIIFNALTKLLSTSDKNMQKLEKYTVESIDKAFESTFDEMKRSARINNKLSLKSFLTR